MTVGILKETFPGERRVAVIPAGVATLKKAGITVVVEPGAGTSAGFPDDQYVAQGATVGSSRADVIARADCLLQVRTPGANPVSGRADAEALRSGQVIVGMADPLGTPEAADYLAARGVTSFALELIPRITRAQSMDVLSSMATVAGYKAVLLAADTMPRMCPMLMTAAGMGITAPVQDEKRGTDRRGLAILDGGKIEPDSQVLEAVSAALALGSDINASNPAGDTALHIAAAQGHGDVVKLLASHGADLNVRNAKGLTPLAAVATRAGRKSMVDLLRSLGAAE